MSSRDSEPLAEVLNLLISKECLRDFCNRLQARIGERTQKEEDNEQDEGSSDTITEEEVRKAMRATIEKRVFPKLIRPYPITLDEILDTACPQIEYLKLNSTGRIEEGYRRFIYFLSDLICDDQGDDFSLGHWSGPRDGDSGGEVLLERYPQCSIFVRQDPSPFLPVFGGTVKANWMGLLSIKAFDSATEEFRLTAKSIAYSIHLVGNCRIEKLENGTSSVHRPSVDDLLSPWGRAMFAACAEAFYEPPAKKTGNLKQRLRNAVILLTESDSQTNDAVKLSLSFAAIEALVCQKTDGISDELSRNVVTLLQAPPRGRKDGIRFVKNLYNLRSKALHGASLSAESKDALIARRLAAAVLRGVVEWVRHQEMMATDAQRDDLLSELSSADVAASAMVGPSEELKRFLKANDPSLDAFDRWS